MLWSKTRCLSPSVTSHIISPTRRKQLGCSKKQTVREDYTWPLRRDHSQWFFNVCTIIIRFPRSTSKNLVTWSSASSHPVVSQQLPTGCDEADTMISHSWVSLHVVYNMSHIGPLINSVLFKTGDQTTILSAHTVCYAEKEAATITLWFLPH